MICVAQGLIVVGRDYEFDYFTRYLRKWMFVVINPRTNQMLFGQRKVVQNFVNFVNEKAIRTVGGAMFYTICQHQSMSSTHDLRL